MLIVTAVNVTQDNHMNKVLERLDGTSDYVVEVAINAAPPIFSGYIANHVRELGAATLLRMIADKMDEDKIEKMRKKQGIEP